MDYLDPKKQKEHVVRLFIGYFLVATALFLMTTVLLYHAYGFGIKNGEVIQSGLIFVSSRPDGAEVYVNGKKHQEVTNSRFLMNAGQYAFEIRREGYHTWKRAINIEGGSVVRFDYPVLFPAKLVTETVKRYDAQPPLATQSPDRRWYMVQSPTNQLGFDVYDIDAPDKAPEAITLPDNVLGLQGGLHRWSLGEWARDNRRVLLQHSMEKDGVTNTEYIIVDREKPAESINVTKTLNVPNQTVSLRDKKFDLYYVHDKTAQTLTTASLEAPTPQSLLQGVLSFKSYGSQIVLYATEESAPEGKVVVRLRDGDQTDTLRTISKGNAYVLDIARYDQAWYVVLGSPTENRTYVYKNPVQALQAKPKAPLVPVQVLKAATPGYIAFSDNARFSMAQGGSQIAVYDAETDRGYTYQLPAPVDAPQTHVTWMDGHRLMAVVGGKVQVFDFDNANVRMLSAASASFVPFFDRDFKNLYAFAPANKTDATATTQYNLTSTSLLIPADQ